MTGDANPYEPPRTSPPAPTAKNVVGLGFILLLIPFALAVALLIGCGAAYATIEIIPWNTGGITDTIVLVALIAFLLPPATTLVAIIWWAVRLSRRPKSSQ